MRLCMKTASTSRVRSLARIPSNAGRQTKPAGNTSGTPSATSTETVPTSASRSLCGESALLNARSTWATQTAAPQPARLNVQIREGEQKKYFPDRQFSSTGDRVRQRGQRSVGESPAAVRNTLTRSLFYPFFTHVF